MIMHPDSSKKPTYQIRMVHSGDDLNINQLAGLISQLSSDAPPLQKSTISEIINTNDIKIFIAVDNKKPNEIIGVLLIVILHLFTSSKIRIEDVVVNKIYRGKGVGEAMLKNAISYAKEIGVAKIDLTCTPDKIAANNLYKKLGFKQGNTNVYRLEL